MDTSPRTNELSLAMQTNLVKGLLDIYAMGLFLGMPTILYGIS